MAILKKHQKKPALIGFLIGLFVLILNFGILHSEILGATINILSLPVLIPFVIAIYIYGLIFNPGDDYGLGTYLAIAFFALSYIAFPFITALIGIFIAFIVKKIRHEK